MADYTYTGIDKSGQKVTGRVDAPTEGDLRMLLRTRGIRPTKIQKAASASEKFTKAMGGGISSVPLSEVVLFTRQLQLLLNAGVPLLQGLTILHEQTLHRGFKTILGTVKDKVSQGAFFWESIAPYNHVFPNLYTALVRAGEASGSLDQMLKRLSKYLEDSERLRRMLKSAMMYPIIVSCIGVGVVALMLIFVIPKFEEMLTGAGQSLPEVTQFVIDMSHFLIGNILQIIGGLGAFIYLATRYAKSAEGKGMIDRVLYRVPGIGPMMQKAGIARFSRTLQTLLMSGINVIDAIDICKATVDNVVIEEAVGKIRAEVEAGKTVGMVINKLDVFPKMAVQMIMVGESTGNMDKMLEKIADFYEEELEVLIGGLSKMIEPIVLVFLGGAVGGIMIAMYMPIFKLAGGAGE